MRRSARQPRELRFLADRYCRRRRILTPTAPSLPRRQCGCLYELGVQPGGVASVITFIPVSRGTCPVNLSRGLYGESTDSTRSDARSHDPRAPVLCDGSKRRATVLSRYPTRRIRPVIRPLFFHFTTVICLRQPLWWSHARPLPERRGRNFFFLPDAARLKGKKEITLSGGSLGSCVDEERSQLRELM